MGERKERITLDSIKSEFNAQWADNEELSAFNALQKLEGFNSFVFWKVTCENSHHKIFLLNSGKLHFEAHPKSIDWEVEIPSNQIIYEQEGNTGFACRCEEVRDLWRCCFEDLRVSALPAGGGTTVDLKETMRTGGIVFKKSPVSMRRAMLQLLALRDLRKTVHAAGIQGPDGYGYSVVRARPTRYSVSRLRGIGKGDRRYVESFSRRILSANYSNGLTARRYTVRSRKSSRFRVLREVSAETGGHIFGCRIPHLLKIQNIKLITLDLQHQERWFEDRRTAIRVSYFATENNHPVFRQGWAEREEYRQGKRWRVVEDKTNKTHWGEEHD